MKQTKLTTFVSNKFDGKATISRLLAHPRMKQYRFDSTSKTFTDDKQVKWGGSLKRLARKFYPNYDDSDNNKKRKSGSSKELGKKIHRHMQHRVNCRKGACTCDIKTRGFNKRAKAMIKMLDEQEDIELLKAEVPVVSEQGCFGTLLDLVGVRRKSGASVLISVKTGYDGRQSKIFPLEGKNLPHGFF